MFNEAARLCLVDGLHVVRPNHRREIAGKLSNAARVSACPMELNCGQPSDRIVEGRDQPQHDLPCDLVNPDKCEVEDSLTLRERGEQLIDIVGLGARAPAVHLGLDVHQNPDPVDHKGNVIEAMIGLMSQDQSLYSISALFGVGDRGGRQSVCAARRQRLPGEPRPAVAAS